ERHAYAAGIHNAGFADHSIKLHVRVTADDQRSVDARKDWEETLFGGLPSKDFVVVSRRRVAEQDAANSRNRDGERLRPTRRRTLLFGIELLSRPADDVPKLLRNARMPAGSLGENRHLAVALDKIDGQIEVKQNAESFPRHWTGNDIAAD